MKLIIQLQMEGLLSYAPGYLLLTLSGTRLKSQGEQAVFWQKVISSSERQFLIVSLILACECPDRAADRGEVEQGLIAQFSFVIYLQCCFSRVIIYLTNLLRRKTNEGNFPSRIY